MMNYNFIAGNKHMTIDGAGNIIIGSNMFTISGETGKTSIAGDVSLNNNVDISENLYVSGDVLFNGNLVTNGSIRGGYNTNTTSYFGRTAIGFTGHGDYAGIAHIDSNNTTSFALIQSTQGVTILNAASTKYIDLRINNQTKVRLAADGKFGIGTAAPTSLLTVAGDASLNGNVDISDNLTVSGSIISNGRITVAGDTSLNGEVDITGSLKVAYDTNTSSYLGKAKVGFNGYHTDWASFKHLNTDNQTGYAFIQNHLGRTFFNVC